ncbi:MAG: ArsR family transcriptional regulator [Promethearchaeota archaeon]
MTNKTFDEHIFSLFKSKIRIKILDFLIKKGREMHFKDIAKEFEILPSTLVYHLKQMTDSGLISHVDNKYFASLYSKMIFDLLNRFARFESHRDFFSTHLFPIYDLELFKSFCNLEIEIAPDLVSLLSVMGDSFIKSMNTIRLAGRFNIELEKKMIIFSKMDFRDSKIEIISDLENILEMSENEFFLELTDLKNINIYLVDRCNYYLGIMDNFGVLFLPKIDGMIDYQQCVFFNNPKNIQWLQYFFEKIKRQAKPIYLKEAYKHNREKMREYINSQIQKK